MNERTCTSQESSFCSRLTGNFNSISSEYDLPLLTPTITVTGATLRNIETLLALMWSKKIMRKSNSGGSVGVGESNVFFLVHSYRPSSVISV